MKKVHLLQTMMLSCLILLCGCMRPREIYYAESEGKISVEGDKIYLNNELYAELRYAGSYYAELRTDRLNKENLNNTGYAIYYYPYDKEEWIFPKLGLGYYVDEEKKKYSTIAEMEEFKRTAKEQGYTLHSDVTGLDFLDREKVFLLIGDKIWEPIEKSPTPTAVDIQITEDGRYVCYKVKGEFGTSSYKYYRVKYGNCSTKNR